jgi:hypothetical protein
MAFGFPASYQMVFSDIPKDTDISRSVGSALSRIGWNPTLEKNIYKASTNLSMGSSGEKITIEILTNKSIKITSKSSVIFQFVDFGKNKRNIDRFLEELPRHIVATGSLGSLR